MRLPPRKARRPCPAAPALAVALAALGITMWTHAAPPSPPPPSPPAPTPPAAASAAPPALQPSPAARPPGWYLPEPARARCVDPPLAPAAAALHARTAQLAQRRGAQAPEAWATAVFRALCAVGLDITPEHVALVLAKIEQESGLDPRGVLPNQPDAFRKLGYRLIDHLLAGDSPDLQRVLGQDLAGRVVSTAIDTLRRTGILSRELLRAQFDRLHQRFGWGRVTTEWHLEHVVARDMLTLADEISPAGLTLRAALALKPEWRQRLADGQVLRTLGPLQVGVETALAQAAEDGWALSEAQMRTLLYTIDGGVYHGLRRLQPAIVANTDLGPLTPDIARYIAADFRLGAYTCRNAALVHQIARLAGSALAPDTRLRSAPVRALLLGLEPQLAPHLGQASARYPASVNGFLQRARQRELAAHPLTQALRAAYQERFGQPPPLGLVPDQRFVSAKTGAYRIGVVSDQVSRRFVANCAALGCWPASAVPDAARTPVPASRNA